MNKVMMQTNDGIEKRPGDGGLHGVQKPAMMWPLDVGYILCTVLVFHEVLFSAARPVTRDILHYFYPIATSLAEAWRGTGSFLWDSGVDQGLPVIARWSPAIFYPAHWLFAVLPADAAITLALLAHIPLAASSTMRLATRYTDNPAAAWLAGLAFGFSGYLFSMQGGVTYLYGAALLPLSLLVLHRLAERPTGWRTVQLSLVIAAQVFCADPQTLLYEIIVLFPLISILPGTHSSGAPHRRIVAAALALAIAAAISACQWWPVLELTPLSIRAGGLPLREILTWSLHPLRLTELIIPHVFGSLAPENTFWARSLINSSLSLPWAPSIYIGLLTLAGLCAFSKETRRKAFGIICAATLLFLVCAFGKWTPLFPALLSLVPNAGMFRYPEKFMLFASLGLAIAGAMGIDRLLEHVKSSPTGSRLPLMRVLAALAVIATTTLCARLWLRPGSAAVEEWFAALVRSQSALVDPGLALSATASALERTFAISLAFIAILSLARHLRPSISVGLIVMVFVADMSTAALPLRVLGDSLWLARPPHACAALPPPDHGVRPTIWRDGSMQYGELFGAPKNGMRAERQRRWEWDSLKPNAGSSTCVRHVEGYDAGRLAAHVDLWRAFGKRHDQRLDLFGVEFILARPGAVDAGKYPLRSYLEELDVSIHENVDRLPFAHVVQAVEAVSSTHAAIARVVSPDFPLKETAVFETADRLPRGLDAARAVSVAGHTEGLIRLRASFAAPGYLIVLENHYPGWAADIDGKPTELYRANGTFMGLQVPEGTHEVTLRFMPKRQVMANAVSMGTTALIACLALLVFILERLRRRAGQAPEAEECRRPSPGEGNGRQ